MRHGNKIIETTDNYCIHKGNIFNMMDGQICSVTNSGYILPGHTTPPVAVLILSFKPKSKTDLSGILLCVPIYDSGNPSHDAYLNQFITQSDPSDKNVNAPTLESIFYSQGDITQTSFAYTTCFETIDKNVTNSKSLYVVVFPNGIHVTQAGFQTLKTNIVKNESFPPYMVPIDIRDAESTFRSYRFDKSTKVPTITSTDGIIYSTPISSCTDDFKYRFEYFTYPPKLSPKKVDTDKCQYSTKQYKCVPFKQLQDSNKCIIQNGETLQDYIDRQKSTDAKSTDAKSTDANSINANSINVKSIDTNSIPDVSSSVTTAQIEIIVGNVIGIILVTGLFLKLGSWISKHY